MCQPTRQDQVQINGTSHSIVRDDPALNPTSSSQEAPREESLQLLRTGQQVSTGRGNQKKNCFKGAMTAKPLPVHSRVTLCLNHRQKTRHERSPKWVPLVLGPSQGEGTPISGYSSQRVVQGPIGVMGAAMEGHSPLVKKPALPSVVPRGGHSKASLPVLDLRLLSWLPLLLAHWVQRAECILHGKAPQSTEINKQMEKLVHSQPRMPVSRERATCQQTSQHIYSGA